MNSLEEMLTLVYSQCCLFILPLPHLPKEKESLSPSILPSLFPSLCLSPSIPPPRRKGFRGWEQKSILAGVPQALSIFSFLKQGLSNPGTY